MQIDTWINNELVTLDTDHAWAEAFAEWDALVSTDEAVRMANAIAECLRQIAEDRNLSDN